MEPPIEYYAARQAIKSLGPADIARAVDGLADEGAWDDAFVDVMFAHAAQAHDVFPGFLRALEDLHVPVPSREEAVRYLIDFHTCRIARGDVDPLEGLERLINDVYWNYDFSAHTAKYLGDSHGMEGLIGVYWSYVDWRDHECPVSTVEDFRERALWEAGDWQARASR